MYLTGNFVSLGENVVPIRATSCDGINWDIDPTPLLSKGMNKEDFDYDKVETPSVIVFKGTYHMYYTAVHALPMEGLSIGHATSPYGITWTKVAEKPVLAPTGDLHDWNGAQVA